MPALKAILVAKEVMIFREEIFNGARERANSLNIFILTRFPEGGFICNILKLLYQTIREPVYFHCLLGKRMGYEINCYSGVRVNKKIKEAAANTIKETNITSCERGFIVGEIPMPYKDSTFFCSRRA